MAMLPPLPSPSSSSSLHISHCPHRLLLFYHRQLLPNSKAVLFSSATRAADPNTTPTPTDSDSETNPDSPKSDPDRFESRLSQVRLRYRSGTGKKAEIRKNRKSTSYSKKGSSSSSSGSGVLLPPVPLREQVSSDGLKVEFGFSPYSERVNGWIAGLGLAALLLVELATGKSVIKYHTPAIVFVQVYFVSAVSALYLKYEKERQSIWPQAMK
ncbi:hypothetical protein Nepgr_015180 [Nepenthes gracilis]|uniref:Uncharacterized protein n=1 Tax=Nepenthes gracilis TaxID=150966 RepID=A0AAD3SMF4_NEPGR|nr:hypothetical protein Nepgr_015180 [Nepenthes gracilis]